MKRRIAIGLLAASLSACMGGADRAPGFYAPPPPGAVQTLPTAMQPVATLGQQDPAYSSGSIFKVNEG